MPLVFAENEATESGISYDDRTGVSYQYPARYRRIIQSGERFVYYKGRKSRDGARVPQVYFGAGVVGAIQPDPGRPDCFMCEVLDYRPFSKPITFKDARGEYFESGANRRGYFQPGVRIIPEADFRRIIEAARLDRPVYGEHNVGSATEAAERTAAAWYASLATLRAVEEFAVRMALDDVRRRYFHAEVERQPHNNPGFDILVRLSSDELLYIEVKGTARGYPQFFLTEGERRFSERQGDRYRLIVVYGINLDGGAYELFWHEGTVSGESGFSLNPVQWSVEVLRPMPAGSSNPTSYDSNS